VITTEAIRDLRRAGRAWTIAAGTAISGSSQRPGQQTGAAVRFRDGDMVASGSFARDE